MVNQALWRIIIDLHNIFSLLKITSSLRLFLRKMDILVFKTKIEVETHGCQKLFPVTICRGVEGGGIDKKNYGGGEQPAGAEVGCTCSQSVAQGSSINQIYR